MMHYIIVLASLALCSAGSPASDISESNFNDVSKEGNDVTKSIERQHLQQTVNRERRGDDLWRRFMTGGIDAAFGKRENDEDIEKIVKSAFHDDKGKLDEKEIIAKQNQITKIYNDKVAKVIQLETDAEVLERELLDYILEKAVNEDNSNRDEVNKFYAGGFSKFRSKDFLKDLLASKPKLKERIARDFGEMKKLRLELFRNEEEFCNLPLDKINMGTLEDRKRTKNRLKDIALSNQIWLLLYTEPAFEKLLA